MTGTELRHLRLRTRLTQREFAKLLGLNGNSFSQMERGTRRIRVVVALAAEHLVTCPQLKGGKR
jgi:transcriptional regulator with XRE-family HTH domain